MYSINNISFNTWGVVPGRAPGSNIALSGHLDLPERTGKLFHSWGDEHGIEPYVDASEIFFSGRNLNFYGFIIGSRYEVSLKLQELYSIFNDFTALVPFATPYGIFEVYVKDAIQVEASRLYSRLTFTFTEPTPVIPVVVPTGTDVHLQHIDGVSFTSLGCVVKSIEDVLNRPKTKQAAFTKYGSEGYAITKQEALDVQLNLSFFADDYAAMKANIDSFAALLAAPGIRTINLDGLEREAFAIKGLSISNIKILNGICVCDITCNLLLPNASNGLNVKYLLDNFGVPILTNKNEYIRL
jgi:hypothetical protein